MATRALTIDDSAGKGRSVRWTGLLNGDDGQSFDALDFSKVSVQVFGTFGIGGTLLVEGSNETTPTTWATLDDTSSTALSFTAAKIEALLGAVRWIRVRVSAGDGTTSLTVWVWALRGK